MNIDTALNTTVDNSLKNVQSKINRDINDKALKESCMEFESIFIKQMLKSMKSTIVKSDLIKEGMGEKIFDDMLYDEYAKKMSKTSDFGIGEMMYRSLSKYNS